MQIQKMAVDSGYWPLFRYDPRLKETGETPFQLDSRRIKSSLAGYLKNENRYAALTRSDAGRAEMLQGAFEDYTIKRMEHMQRASMDDSELLDFLKENVGESTGEKVLILYASETGITADLSKHVVYEMKRRGVRAKAMKFDDYDVQDMPKEKTVINLVATCGQGEFPQNCKMFYEDLTAEDLPTDFLTGVKFATFAMGDSGYVFYNSCGKMFDERFEALGGERLVPLGLGDDQAEDKWETAYQDWEPELWNEMGTPPPPKVLLPATHTIVIVPKEEVAASVTIPEYIVPKDAAGAGVMVPMTMSRPLTPLGRDVRHYEWDISQVDGVEYEAGDAMGVFSTNGKDKTEEFLQWYGLESDDVIHVGVTKGNDGIGLPAAVTALQLFSQHLDIFGRPKRPFYEVLSLLATDPDEIEELEHLITKEGRGELRELIDDTITYAELMQKFPSAKVPVEYLLDFIPAIKPRLYSIASDSLMHPDHIHCCIVEEDWETSDGNQRRGQSTWFLRNQKPGMKWGEVEQLKNEPEPPFTADGEYLNDGTAPEMFCRVNPAVVHMPEDPATPLIMVGLGTGLAPFRSFIQQRIIQKEQGMETGDNVLYFGARYIDTEFMYRDEMEAWEKDGTIKHLKLAFSRDQEEKIYAQHKIDQGKCNLCYYS